jgi:hypothetical protein
MRLGRLFLLLMAIAAPVAGADADPFLGKWKLNWSKSRSSEQAPKRAIRKYAKSGDGVRVSEDWVDIAGKHLRLNYIAAYDGEDYPVRTKRRVTVAFTHRDPFTIEGVSKTDGKVDYTFKRMVSQDLKTLTVELVKVGADPTVLVYDRM